MESRWERDFPHASIPALGVYPASCATGTASASPAVRQPERVIDHPSLASKNVKVKFSRYRPGVAQRVGRGIALLFRDRGTRRG